MNKPKLYALQTKGLYTVYRDAVTGHPINIPDDPVWRPGTTDMPQTFESLRALQVAFNGYEIILRGEPLQESNDPVVLGPKEQLKVQKAIDAANKVAAAAGDSRVIQGGSKQIENPVAASPAQQPILTAVYALVNELALEAALSATPLVKQTELQGMVKVLKIIEPAVAEHAEKLLTKLQGADHGKEG